MHNERVRPRGAAAARKSDYRIRYDRLIVLVVSVLGASLALADPEPAKTLFDIEAQPASTALTLYARQARVQLGFAPDVVDDIFTNAVKGEYESAQALELLLQGTGLEAEHGENAIIIRRVGKEELASSVQDPKPALASANSLQLVQTADQVPSDTAPLSMRDSNSIEHDEAISKREEIVVTGSRIRGAQIASPVVTITRQQIDQSGFATVEEVVDKLPQNFGAGASLDTRNDGSNSRHFLHGVLGNQAGGTSVNLRGLGPSSTLTLLNGRRMSPSGIDARFTNISSIPITAIERVEVLTDGASAIYGSDAIGGVINFILRDDYEGAETRLRYGSDARGGTANFLLGQSFGTSWDNGNALLTYEYYTSDNLANSERDITSTNDLRRFGGNDWRTPGGNPANIDAGGQLWAIPHGQDGTSLSAADFDPGAPLNLYNSRALDDMLPELERHSAFMKLTQEFGPVELFAEGRFASEQTLTRVTPGNIDLTVTDANPFFVDPTGTGLTSIRVDNYSFEEYLALVRSGQIDSTGGVLGLRFDIGEDWNVEWTGYLYKEEASAGGEGEVGLDLAAVDTALRQTDPNLAFNPFADGATNSDAVIESFIDRSREAGITSENKLQALSVNINGSLLDLPGGSVQLATGVEFREESLVGATNFNRTDAVTTDLRRDVLAAYAELYFPLISASNGRSGFDRLGLSLAARYEDYSDFGNTVNPKLGIVWSPTDSLDFRGTYGTSFRAPALRDLDVSNLDQNLAAYFPQFLVDAGLIPFTMIVRLGANENLQPEQATTWTAGIQWSPERIAGLSLDVTYFDIDFEDRIGLPAAGAGLAGDPRFRTLVNRTPTPEQIAALVNDPRWQDAVFGVPAADILSGAATVDAIFDARINNLSRSVITGVDLQLAYRFETALGSFGVGLNGSYLFDYQRAFIEGDPLKEEIDTYGRPIDFRARGSVSWSHDRWSVTTFVDYADDYTDKVSDPARSIDSWTTIDVSIAYETGRDEGILSDARFSLTARNLLNEDPPFVNTTGGLAYDSANGNPLGRMLGLQITKEW